MGTIPKTPTATKLTLLRAVEAIGPVVQRTAPAYKSVGVAATEGRLLTVEVEIVALVFSMELKEAEALVAEVFTATMKLMQAALDAHNDWCRQGMSRENAFHRARGNYIAYVERAFGLSPEQARRELARLHTMSCRHC